MRIQALLVAASVAFTAFACSGDICSRYESFDPVARYDGCSGNAPRPVQVTQSQCEQDLKSCTEGDQTVLNNYVNCLNDLPECQPGQEQTWNSDYGSCSGMLSALTAQCDAAFLF
jgi:hypothetical protein